MNDTEYKTQRKLSIITTVTNHSKNNIISINKTNKNEMARNTYY